MKFVTTLSALSSVALVAAHGYIQNGTIGGVDYVFYKPYEDPYTSPTPERIARAIQGNGPVQDVLSQDMQCGGYSAGGINGSSPAALHADAVAGSEVTLHWTLWPESHFGALVTYMAKCPDTGCQDYMPESDAVWFKVAESGLIDKATNEWAVTALETAGNSGATYTIPECLASGYYLVRHEIIAVFLANEYPGVQLYPGCHQLKVTGTGSTVPSDLVSFPGAYQPTDAGITWDSSEETYPIPGPALFSCSGSSSSSGSTGASSAVANKAAASSAAASSVPAIQSSVATSSAAPVMTSSAAPVVASTSVAADTPTTLSTAIATASSTASSCKERRMAN
ncbi:glycosyl hydrolase family 61-domain-containing protein [Pseudomassariella vexata]|uniref:lytic cellulose monooxygenase (C4-dehydrogenating) n=1 Tax=Pseudomassariella vexata TaxID=1141098 RepID=A0A1Y2EJ83_9PEZI|nr:glycosyl hydrolase family 61-domain-containing protein [Pseudomassariella vexata]ORY71374.1 glycosyl hydrolase family 61-domain-containing protein [Pseudomassariella vexata]